MEEGALPKETFEIIEGPNHEKQKRRFWKNMFLICAIVLTVCGVIAIQAILQNRISESNKENGKLKLKIHGHELQNNWLQTNVNITRTKNQQLKVTLKQIIENHKNQNEKLQNQNEDLQNRIIEAKEENEKMKAHHSKLIEDHENQNEDFQTRIVEANEENEELGIKNNILQEEITNATIENQILRDKITGLKQEIQNENSGELQLQNFHSKMAKLAPKKS